MDESDRMENQKHVTGEGLVAAADHALMTVFQILKRDDKEAASHLVQEARTAYESIRERRKEVALSATEIATLDDKMDRLRARLRFLGEHV